MTIEDLTQDVKNCCKEMEMTNKKVEEMNKSLKDNQEKAIKHVRETVQGLKN